MDYEAEWENEEEDELLIERTELERWELRHSRARFGSTQHRNLFAAACRRSGERCQGLIYI